MTPMDLSPAHLHQLKALLKRYLPEYEVRVFGSRVHGTAHRASDLDVVIMNETALSLMCRAQLREAFIASDLPFRVDIVEWADTNENFRKVILERWAVLQPAPGAEARARSGNALNR